MGSVEETTEQMYVYDKDKEAIIKKSVTYVPGLYKIFDEILGEWVPEADRNYWGVSQASETHGTCMCVCVRTCVLMKMCTSIKLPRTSLNVQIKQFSCTRMKQEV